MKVLSVTLNIHTNQLLLSMRQLSCSLILLPWLSACSDKAKLPEPPLFFPFDTQTAGFRIETDFRVVDHNSYKFSFKLPFKEGDTTDRERVKKLAGGAQRDKDGKIMQPGVPIPVRIRINAIKPSALEGVFEREYLTADMDSYGFVFYQTVITNPRLKPGTYHLLIESLKSVPEYQGIPVTLTVTTDPKGGTIPE